jgi:hypothetical protein
MTPTEKDLLAGLQGIEGRDTYWSICDLEVWHWSYMLRNEDATDENRCKPTKANEVWAWGPRSIFAGMNASPAQREDLEEWLLLLEDGDMHCDEKAAFRAWRPYCLANY